MEKDNEAKEKPVDKLEEREAPMTHYYNQNEMYADMLNGKGKEHSKLAYILMGVIPIILFVLFFILLAIKG